MNQVSKFCSCLLSAILQVAVDNEVMVAICNLDYAMPGGMLATWVESIKRAGVKNAMVVALDDYTKQYAEEQGVPAHEMHLQVKHQAAVHSAYLLQVRFVASVALKPVAEEQGAPAREVYL